jgi:hypothetical protein
VLNNDETRKITIIFQSLNYDHLNIANIDDRRELIQFFLGHFEWKNVRTLLYTIQDFPCLDVLKYFVKKYLRNGDLKNGKKW